MLPPTHMAPEPATSLDPARWVDEYADYLYRFALARVRHHEVARDLVQETFLSALRARDRFAGRAAERTWLTGILKNKVMDYYRRGKREPLLDDLAWSGAEDAESFGENGHWKYPGATTPREWEQARVTGMDREEFWRRFHACSDQLPEQTRRVFVLREVDGLSGDEICRDLGISPANFWTIMHRARAALRRCLEINWFAVTS